MILLQSFLLGTWCLSALVDFLLAQVFQLLFEYEVEELPAGMWVVCSPKLYILCSLKNVQLFIEVQYMRLPFKLHWSFQFIHKGSSFSIVSPSYRLAPVFSLFVPFYLLIPRMPVTQVLGNIYITNKSLVYVVGLQVSLYIVMLSCLICVLFHLVHP